MDPKNAAGPLFDKVVPVAGGTTFATIELPRTECPFAGVVTPLKGSMTLSSARHRAGGRIVHFSPLAALAASVIATCQESGQRISRLRQRGRQASRGGRSGLAPTPGLSVQPVSRR